MLVTGTLYPGHLLGHGSSHLVKSLTTCFYFFQHHLDVGTIIISPSEEEMDSEKLIVWSKSSDLPKSSLCLLSNPPSTTPPVNAGSGQQVLLAHWTLVQGQDSIPSVLGVPSSLPFTASSLKQNPAPLEGMDLSPC
jgi:hypothetical protein